MPTYKYKFADGSVSEVEVSEELFAALREFDRRERKNNRRQKNLNTSLVAHLLKEEKSARECDSDFAGG